MGLSLDGEEGNPKATKELEQFIELKGTERILLSDVVERFAKRPYGWADTEILLIVGRLAAAGRISLQFGGGTLAVRDTLEHLKNSRLRREVSIIKKRQTDETVLKQARNLTQDLFSAMGPAAEKELFEFYTGYFNQWLNAFKSYKSKTDVGRFPGKATIEQSILTLERILSVDDSFEFFKQVVDNKNDYSGLEKDYLNQHEFFSNQLHTWQQLQQALHDFEKNKQALERDPKAKQALAEMQSIENADAPYNMLHKVAGLVGTVKAVNESLLKEKRNHALARVDEKIGQLKAEIDKSGIASPELSNRLLRPLQLVKTDIETEASIAGIYMLQTQTAAEKLDDGLHDLEQAVQPVSKPKPVVEVAVSSVFNKVSDSVYLESETEINNFVEALKADLLAEVRVGKRVRVR
ncbi:MAG: hypothetical protein KAG53_03155 [Endozoicomonadaceae bacterium]|nr:hypothetical protein [Endozoicomonadaceae bacterium]